MCKCGSQLTKLTESSTVHSLCQLACRNHSSFKFPWKNLLQIYEIRGHIVKLTLNMAKQINDCWRHLACDHHVQLIHINIMSRRTWYVFCTNSWNWDNENHFCSRYKTFDIIRSRGVYRWHRDPILESIPLLRNSLDFKRSYIWEVNWWCQQDQ